MTDLRDENEIVEALRRLGAAIEVPPPNPARERALLSAFDARRTSRANGGRRVWMTAAATLTGIVLALDWFALSAHLRQGYGGHGVPRVDPAPLHGPDQAALYDAVDLTGFVPWPGADAWPPLERGEVLRVDLPAAALPALGFAAPPSVVSVVPADIVVGQDGFARAVRLVGAGLARP
jgi:hypothetical protein